MKTQRFSIDTLPLSEECLNIESNYESPLVAVEESTMLPNQKCLRALSFIREKTVIFVFHNSVTENRTRTSIQVEANLHIEAGEFGSCTNHSCKPNAMIVSKCNVQTKQAVVMLITLCNVNAGSELTFDYASTESTLISELLGKDCLCKSSQCRKEMRGYNQLSENQKNDLVKQQIVSNYLKK